MLSLELGQSQAVLQSACNLNGCQPCTPLSLRLTWSQAVAEKREQVRGGFGVGRLSPRLTLLTSARFRTLSTTSSGCFFHGEDMVCTLEEKTKTRVGETPLLVLPWASSLQLYPGPGLTVSRQSWDYDGAVLTSDVEGREAGVRKRMPGSTRLERLRSTPCPIHHMPESPGALKC